MLYGTAPESREERNAIYCQMADEAFDEEEGMKE